MPYIEENDLVGLHKQIDDAKKDAQKAQKELEDIEYDYEEQKEELNVTKKNAKIQNIILSLLTGIAFALALFFYQNGSSSSSNIDIEAIKKAEALRVMDSISANGGLANLNDTADSDIQNDGDLNGISTEQSISDIKQSISGEKVYSVQIGAFYENRYPSLSESLAGISSNGEMFKYSIGLFKTLKEAQKFRQELVQVGFDDAFVASYVDGRRKSIENPN